MTKIKHIWSVLCKDSVIDQTDNNISLHGVLEQLTVSVSLQDQTENVSTMGIPLDYQIVSMWQKVGKLQIVAEGEIEYILTDPKGKDLLRNTQIIKISKALRRFRSRMKISGLPLTSSGDYIFQIRFKGENSREFKLISELPLEVEIKFSKKTSKSN